VLEAEVIVVSSFDDLTARAAEAEGKIVVWNVPFTTYGHTVAYRVGGGAAAEQVNAVASLVRSVTPYSMQTPHTGSGGTSSVPVGAVSVEDALQMQRMVDRGQSVVLQLYMEAMDMGMATRYGRLAGWCWVGS
jgi:carboxypeptidase Q